MNSTKVKPSVVTPDGRDCCADLFKLADAFFANLRRGDCEYGGWGLDDKRPFGNSDVIGDVLEIIGWGPVVDDYHAAAQEGYAAELYDELGEFLRARWKEYRETRSVPEEPKSDSASGASGEAERGLNQ